MMMFHGIRHYAVYERDVGTFRGRDKNPTIKVYDGCANSPRLTVSGELVEKMHRRLCVIRKDRQLVEAYLLGSIQASASIEQPSNPSVQYAMQRFYAKLNEERTAYQPGIRDLWTQPHDDHCAWLRGKPCDCGQPRL